MYKGREGEKERGEKEMQILSAEKRLAASFSITCCLPIDNFPDILLVVARQADSSQAAMMAARRTMPSKAVAGQPVNPYHPSISQQF